MLQMPIHIPSKKIANFFYFNLNAIDSAVDTVDLFEIVCTLLIIINYRVANCVKHAVGYP